MNADEFEKKWQKAHKAGRYPGEPTRKLNVFAIGIAEILRRLDELDDKLDKEFRRLRIIAR